MPSASSTWSSGQSLDETIIAILGACMVVYVVMTAFHFVRAVGTAERGIDLGEEDSDASSSGGPEERDDEDLSHDSSHGTGVGDPSIEGPGSPEAVD